MTTISKPSKVASYKSPVNTVTVRLCTPQSITRNEICETEDNNGKKTVVSEMVRYQGTQFNNPGALMTLNYDALIDKQGNAKPVWNGPDNAAFGRLTLISGTFPETRGQKSATKIAETEQEEILLANTSSNIIESLGEYDSAELKKILEVEQKGKKRGGVVSAIRKLL